MKGMNGIIREGSSPISQYYDRSTILSRPERSDHVLYNSQVIVMPTQVLPELFIQLEKQGQKQRNAFVTNLPWNVEKAGGTCLVNMSTIELCPSD